MIDTSLLGGLAMSTMEAISDEFGDDLQIRTVAVIVELDCEKFSQFVVRCSDDRVWVLEALLHEAENSVIERREALKAAIEDDDE